MARISLYRRGIVINYPPNAAAKAGSCIFIHVWRRPGSGTLGCIAASESNVQALQTFAASVASRQGAAVAAILPAKTLARLRDCLPAHD